MRTVKKNGHTVLVVKAHRRESGWNSELTLALFKIGRHVFVHEDDAAGALDTLTGKWLDDSSPQPKEILDSAKGDALLFAGPKTLVRLISEAVKLKGVSVEARHSDAIRSPFADYQREWSFRKNDNHARFRLHREGARVLFKAPCGATGYITLRDAEKLIEAIPSL